MFTLLHFLGSRVISIPSIPTQKGTSIQSVQRRCHDINQGVSVGKYVFLVFWPCHPF